MNERQKEIIANEEYDLEKINEEIINLNKKWFKTSITYTIIEFLESYKKLKEKLIKELKK